MERAGEAAENGWQAWTLASAFVAIGLWSFALLYEGFIADHYSGIFTYPFVDEAAAVRAYQRLPPNAPIAERQVAAWRLVLADRTNPESWTAVSYVEYLKAGGMSKRALFFLQESYALVVFDDAEPIWRIGYALDNWSYLPPALRQKVMTEADIALQYPELAQSLKARLRAVSDPQGRLAAALIFASSDPKVSGTSPSAAASAGPPGQQHGGDRQK